VKVYIAGSFPSRERLRLEATRLYALGFEIVSSWLNEVQKPAHMTMEIFHKKLAIKDVSEVLSADLLIVDNLDDLSRGGKSVEMGLALGAFQSSLIYRIGPATNVFHQLADQVFKNWDECMAYCKEHHSQNKETLIV